MPAPDGDMRGRTGHTDPMSDQTTAPNGLTRLAERRVLKPWGRNDLPPQFEGQADGERVGEIWFERPSGGGSDSLLIKYLFTSERLSIQVHPDDEAARTCGHARGKDEAWLVLDAQPGAHIGLGLKAAFSDDDIAAAVETGTLDELVDWRPVEAGDCFYSPAGTIHSIGPGLVLLEIQQNVDLTYRLYDFGRDREIHVAQGLAAIDPSSSVTTNASRPLEPGRMLLVQGPKFTVEKWTVAPGRLPAQADSPVWLVPLRGICMAGSVQLGAPEAWIAEQPVEVVIPEGSELLVVYEGEAVRPPG